MAIVDNNVFNGKAHYYPYAFKKSNVQRIVQVVGGEEYPYERLELTNDNRSDALVTSDRCKPADP